MLTGAALSTAAKAFLLAPTAVFGVGVALFPYMWAYNGLDPAQPYAQAHGSLQLDNGPRAVPRAGARFSTAHRLGGSFDWAGFERRDYYVAHVTADTSENEGELAEWGLGLARLEGDDSRWGGSLELNWDGFTRKPLTAHARYQTAVLTDKRFYHDLSLHVGVMWSRFGLSAGYRAWLTPLRNSTGPEVMLRVWL